MFPFPALRHGAAMILLVFLGVATCFGSNAFAQARLESPYLVFELKSGRIYAHHKAHDRWYPASLTKIMTAYTVFREIKARHITLFSPVKVSAYAAAKPPSKMGFPIDTVLNVDAALKIIMVKSANDVTTALAESVGGTEANFVELMNRNAQRLGMLDTHFANPHGLHDIRQYTSARDLAVLVTQLNREFPQYAQYFSIPAIRVGSKTLRNHNRLLTDFPGTNGMKTGFVCASGVNIVASAKLRGKTYVAVVLGQIKSRQRNVYAAKLLNQASEKFFAFALPKLTSFKPQGNVKRGPVDLRQEVCGKGKTDAADMDEDALETIFTLKKPTLEEQELRYYRKSSAPLRAITISLGNATGPDPFGLLRDNSVPLPSPELALADGKLPNQPDAYTEVLTETKNTARSLQKRYELAGIGIVAVPTPRPFIPLENNTQLQN